MPANDQPWDVTSGTDVEASVRGLTDYGDAEIDDSTFTEILNAAKRELALRADVTDFYDDRGLAQALVGMTCVQAKAHVENQPVRTDNIGPNDVTFRTTDGSSLQVGQYEQMIQTGLAHADEGDSAKPNIYLTNGYMTEDRTGPTESRLERLEDRYD